MGRGEDGVVSGWRLVWGGIRGAGFIGRGGIYYFFLGVLSVYGMSAGEVVV